MNAPEGFAQEVAIGGLEFRSLPISVAPVEARAASDDMGPVIAGYGSVFDQQTTIRGLFVEWDEEVAPGAWANSIATGDVRAMFNHDTNRLLGRTKPGTLVLAEDETGLGYRVAVNPDDPLAMSTHAQVKRGDVDGSSVWFRVIDEQWTYPDDVNQLERPVRRILEGALYEVGPVTFPAFEQTTSQARSLAPLDAALRSRGMKDAKRAVIGADLLSDMAAAEAAIVELFAEDPELRDSVCSCEVQPPQVATRSEWRLSARRHLHEKNK